MPASLDFHGRRATALSLQSDHNLSQPQMLQRRRFPTRPMLPCRGRPVFTKIAFPGILKNVNPTMLIQILTTADRRAI